MSQLLTRFADGLLARLVPHQTAHAQPYECPSGYWKFCYCRGDRMYQKYCELFYAPGGQCIVGCGSCRITRTC